MAALLAAGMSCLAYADALDLLKSGLAARNRGDFAAAAKFYTQAIDSGNLAGAALEAVLTGRGVAYDMAGDTDRAIEDFDAAIRAYPELSTAYIHRGLAWAKKRDFKRAIVDFGEAISRDPSQAFLALNDRGNAYEAVGEYERAIEDYGRAIELNPIYAPAYYNRAGVYSNMANYDQAIDDYGRAIELQPNYADAFNNRGVAYLAKDAVEKAVADFSAAIRFDPNNTAVLRNRASTYAAESQFERAVADFSAAIKLKPEFARLYVDRARAELYLGRTEASIADLTTAIKLSPSDPHAVIWLHLAHVRAAVDDLRELKQNSANVDRKKWPGPIIDLYLGEASPQTINAAGLANVNTKIRSERACEIAFYLGTFELERGSLVEARRDLEVAANACPPSVVELGAAKAELTRLQSTH
jgi:tetratricopeptide (TPR) repeat protein